MVTHIVATPDVARAAAAHTGPNNIGVALFHAGSPALPGLGGNLPTQFRRGLPTPTSPMAWDFLSIALAAFAADRFALRRDAEDGWTRVIALDIAVQDPMMWTPQSKRLGGALRFLTGDIWSVRFSPGGGAPPNFQGRLHDRDAVCLFSGGLDSLLGALKLLEDGKAPLLVSQGSPKEVTPQKYLANLIGLDAHRLDGRVNEKWRPPYEPSTRGRSLIFFAYGVVAAVALGLKEVIVPENGLIAVNPPLTRRRMGSLSTRTTHPHFLGEINAILQAVGINVGLNNIFEDRTKGQMLADEKHAKLATLAGASYSCGKGKRLNAQCGRCIPCLIRRASFHASGVQDRTARYASKLDQSRRNDDVLSARFAVTRMARMSPEAFERWVAMAGPLPTDAARRSRIVSAVRNGLNEVSDFLDSIRWR